MSSEPNRNRKQRIPKVSSEPEVASNNRYTIAFRVCGKPRKFRLDRDPCQSCIIARDLVKKHLGLDLTLSELGGNIPQFPILLERRLRAEQVGAIEASDGKCLTGPINSLPVIAADYLTEERQRVRGDNKKDNGLSISMPEYHAIEYSTMNLLTYLTEQFPSIRQIPFSKLMDVEDYDRMLVHLSNKFGPHQFRKHRRRFWCLARHARGKRFGEMVPFGPDDGKRIRPVKEEKEYTMPGIKTLQAILEAGEAREQAMIWMGLGLAFGNQDISQARPANFSEGKYNQPRIKTRKRFPRHGKMPPMVWAHIQAYLQSTPREPTERLFITGNGLAMVYRYTKSEAQKKFGTITRKPSKTDYVHVDNVRLTWERVLGRAEVDWHEGFYVLRHIAATAYGKLNPRLADVRLFLGHGISETADRYLEDISPEFEPLIDWVNRMLWSKDPNAWRHPA